MPAITVTLTETEVTHIREMLQEDLETAKWGIEHLPSSDPYDLYRIIKELDEGIIQKLDEAPEAEYPPILCMDCGANHDEDMYMVTDELWAQAGLEHHDLCCKDCLSKRISRPIVESDYTNCPLNWWNVPGFMNTDGV
jgi:hypothetical protein